MRVLHFLRREAWLAATLDPFNFFGPVGKTRLVAGYLGGFLILLMVLFAFA